MSRKKKVKGLISIEELKQRTNQPHLSDEEAQELIESLAVLSKITYRAIMNE